MSGSDETGKFSVDISQSVIDEAVKAVERREQKVRESGLRKPTEGKPGEGKPGEGDASQAVTDPAVPAVTTGAAPGGTAMGGTAMGGTAMGGAATVSASSAPAAGAPAAGAPVSGTSGIRSMSPPAAAPAAPVEAAPDPKDAEIASLKASLDMSLSRGREMMQKLKDEHEKYTNEHERMLRASADLENYKKRAQKEKEDVQKFGSEKLLKDFLPVFDNFDRALEHAKSSADFDSLKKGVEMIRKLFEDTLGKHGVKAFSSKGKPFDPNLHEAMTAAETAEVPPNHVLNEVLRGFTLNDRLVRPALVVVSRAPAAPVASEAPAAQAAPSATSETNAAETEQPRADGDAPKEPGSNS